LQRENAKPLTGAGVLLIRAHEGMKDEWLDDTSFIVVGVSSAVAPQML
jgi:hypothetical protein